jgi:hypothetical protein
MFFQTEIINHFTLDDSFVVIEVDEINYVMYIFAVDIEDGTDI